MNKRNYVGRIVPMSIGHGALICAALSASIDEMPYEYGIVLKDDGVFYIFREAGYNKNMGAIDAFFKNLAEKFSVRIHAEFTKEELGD